MKRSYSTNVGDKTGRQDWELVQGFSIPFMGQSSDEQRNCVLVALLFLLTWGSSLDVRHAITIRSQTLGSMPPLVSDHLVLFWNTWLCCSSFLEYGVMGQFSTFGKFLNIIDSHFSMKKRPWRCIEVEALRLSFFMPFLSLLFFPQKSISFYSKPSPASILWSGWGKVRGSVFKWSSHPQRGGQASFPFVPQVAIQQQSPPLSWSLHLKPQRCFLIWFCLILAISHTRHIFMFCVVTNG